MIPNTCLDPCAVHVTTDLEEPSLVSGIELGRWRIISFNFPILDFTISATELDGKASEYGFRAELTNYPAQAPMVHIWDHESAALLADHQRPRGGERVKKTFQRWGSETVYRPWERMTGPHNNNASASPHLAWNPERSLTFIFEDLYEILNSNARAQSIRTAA